jgi:transcriptional regulator with XRE-family HTH domain
MDPTGVISQSMTPDSPLRRWRLKRKLTQGQLATLCGVKMQTVARWERAEQDGGRKPTGRGLVELIRHTKLPAEALLFPETYLREHPEFLQAWASESRGPGRPPEGRTQA